MYGYALRAHGGLIGHAAAPTPPRPAPPTVAPYGGGATHVYTFSLRSPCIFWILFAMERSMKRSPI